MVRSFWIADEYSYATMNPERIDGPFMMYSLYIDRGRVGGQKLISQVEMGDRGMNQGWKLGWQHDPAEPGDLLPPVEGLRFHFEHFDYVEWGAGPVRGWEFQIPLWCPAALMLVAPAVWIWRSVRLRRLGRRGFSVVSVESVAARELN